MNDECAIQQLLATMSLAVREIPTTSGFQHRTFALIDDEARFPEMDLTAQPIRLVGLASGYTLKSTLYDLVEAAITLRRDSTNTSFDGIGFGYDEATATNRALLHSWERFAEILFADNICQHCAQSEAARFVKEIKNLDGQVVVSRYDNLLSVPVVVAELVFQQPPYYLAAVGCGDFAEERATLAAYSKFDAYQLPRLRGARWIDVASVPCEHTNEPARTTRLAMAPEHKILTRAWQNGDFWVAQSQIQTSMPPRSDEVLSRVDATSIGLKGPVHFAMSHAKRSVHLSRTFHENSKLRTRFKTSPVFDIGAASAPVRRALAHAARDYRYSKLELPLDIGPSIPAKPVDYVLRHRRSWASMSEDPMTFHELSRILSVAYGVTGFGRIGGGPERVPLRATPSGGGLYSNDLFVLAERVTGMEPGLYYFNPDRHVLQLADEDARLAHVAEQTGYQARVRKASAMVLLGGAFRRNQWKYWERGYRTVLLDCGHLAQSLIIVAGSLNLVAHPIGGFIDDYVNNLVGFDGIDDAILHLLLLGHQGGTNEQS